MRPTLARVATGILWSMIIGLWAAYLVPLWIARDETARLEADATLDGGAFSGGAGSRGLVTLPGGDAGERSTVRRDEDTPHVRDEPPPRRRRGTRMTRLLARRRARVVARRRRTLSGLVLTLLVISSAVSLGPMPGWAAAAGGLVLGDYLVHLRRQARRVQSARRQRGGGKRAPAPRRPRPAPTKAPHREAGPARPPTGAAQPGEPADEESSKALGKASLWRPLPVPLPTYVTNPSAIHPVRAVELTRAAAWSSARFGSEGALRWHAAPAGPALSLGPDASDAPSAGDAATRVDAPAPVEAQPGANFAFGPGPHVQRAVGN